MSDSNSSKLRLPSKISRPCSALPQKQTPSPLSPTSAMNSSTVLTEDTDSFIIGDRVWVGGTKPGSIAYIGETQFAPGDWAGVVLDDPIGKNDGSVAGSRYFQCEPKRGIFSRLTRLTRQPLSETTIPTGERTPTSSVYGSRTNLSKSMSTSLHSSVTSLSSVSQKDVTIGDRVIVSSSQGSKAGVLRFLGPTQFASGDWCGVELDEPVGKNDGTVGEIRYFECRPKYGLFAPLHKVSRSPSSRRTSSTCIVHKPGSSFMTTPPGRLSGSRESIKSTSSRLSTTASSAMRGMAPGSREMLKEKQQEIEMLRNERDLDRQRISRVAAQADNAAKNVITLKEEYDKYKELMELQIHETQTSLAQLLHENNSSKVQLDEEKQKNEDLLFRFEEGSINMDDIQVINSQNENKMKDLEKQLMEERERVIRLEQDNSKLIEARDELAKLRAELSTTEESKTHELQDIQKSYTEASSIFEKQLLERDKLIEQYEKRIQDCETRIRNFESEIVNRSVEQKNLQENIDVVQQSLLEKNTLVEQLKKEYESEIEKFQQQIHQLNITIENITREKHEEKISENIIIEKQLLEREGLIAQYEKQIEDFEAKIKSCESEAAAQTLSQKNLQENIAAMEKSLLEKTAFIEKLQKEFGHDSDKFQTEIKHLTSKIESLTNESDKEKKSLVEQIKQRENVIESMTKENMETKSSLNILEKQLLEREELIEKHEKNIGECEARIQNFESEVVDQSVVQKNLQDNIEAIQRNLVEKNTLLEKLEKEHEIDSEKLNKQVEELKNEIENIKEQSVEEKKLLLEKMEQEKISTENMAKERIEQKNAEYLTLEKQLVERLTEQNEKKVQEFQAELEKSKTEAAAQMVLQKSLQQKIDTMERDLLEKNTFIEKLQKENEVNEKKFHNEIQQLNEMIENITTQSIETKNSENIILQKQLLESKKLIEQHETKIQDYKANIEKCQAEAAAQKVAEKSLQESIDVMQQNLLERETLMEKLKKEYDVSSKAFQTQIEQLKSVIESLTKEGSDEKKSLVEQIEQKQEIIENIRKESENEKKSLSEQIEHLKTTIENEKTQRNEEKKSLVEQIEQLKIAIENAAIESNTEKKSLVDQIEQQQTMIDNLSKQSNEETKSLVEQIEQLKNINEKVAKESKEEKKSLVVEIEQLKKINENLTKESIEEKKVLAEQIEQLQKTVENETKERFEEKKSLIEQIEQLKNMNENIAKKSEEEKKLLAAQIEQLKNINENVTKESIEEKKALTQQIEQLHKTVENTTKESIEEKKSLADQIEQNKKEIENVTKLKNEEQKSLVQQIEQLKNTLENTTKQMSVEQEPLVEQIEQLKNEIDNITKESIAEKRSLVEQVQQQQNMIESITKDRSEEKKLLSDEIEQLKNINEKKTKESMTEKNSLLEQIEQQKNLIENIKKENTEEKKLLLEQIEQQQNIVKNSTEQSNQEKQLLVEQIEQLNKMIENVQLERSEEKKSLIDGHRKKLAEVEESLRLRTAELETHKNLLQSRNTDQINQIANNGEELSAFNEAGEQIEESSRNMEAHEKQTLESKIPSVFKRPEKSLKASEKGATSIACNEAALQSGTKICNDLEKQILLLEGECQSSKSSSINFGKQGVEVRKSLEEVKKHFDFIFDEEKNLQISIAEKNADLVKLGAAISVVEREKHGAGANVDSANTKLNKETLQQQTIKGTKRNPLESVTFEDEVLRTDYEDKAIMDSIAKSEIAVKDLKGKFLEFVKTLKKNKNVESNSSVGLRETESCVKKIEEMMKNCQKDFTEKIKERRKLNIELQAQIDSFESNLKGCESVLNEKNNVMEVTANTSENIVSQLESNPKRIDEVDSSELKKLLDDNETYKSQIEFLNSVIVDMQRKNETLTCKVEVLQMGVPANEADDYSRSTLSKRMTAPRMFCDICDQFDLHETEDCSRQAQDYEQPEATKNSPKKSPVERPYCESCECFGHDTSECDNSETY